jgi:hypothetical protein
MLKIRIGVFLFFSVTCLQFFSGGIFNPVVASALPITINYKFTASNFESSERVNENETLS